MKYVPILSAFVLGALVSWWMLSPDPIVRETTVVKHDTTESVRTEVLGAEDTRVGIPPDSVTPSRPAPNAGQRRALSKALRELEQTMPSTAPADPELAAHLTEKIREHLTIEGDQP